MIDKVLNFLRVVLMGLSKIYDPFFNKKYESSLGAEYSKKIIDLVNEDSSVKQWNDNIISFKSDIQRHGLGKFLRFKMITRTMFVTNRLYILKELFYVKRFLKNRGMPASSIYESSVGFPARYIFYPFSSGNLIHHAYSLCHYLETSGNNVNNFDTIFEFGGGYGGFERVCRNFGFNGDYVIYDLEEMSLLQEYYLNSLDEDRALEERVSRKTKLISGSTNLPDISNQNVLFVALWSLSESPIEVRKSVENIMSNSNGVLIGMQDSFSSINNIDYFKSISSSKELKRLPIQYLGKHQSYLIK